MVCTCVHVCVGNYKFLFGGDATGNNNVSRVSYTFTCAAFSFVGAFKFINAQGSNKQRPTRQSVDASLRTKSTYIKQKEVYITNLIGLSTVFILLRRSHGSSLGTVETNYRRQ